MENLEDRVRWAPFYNEVLTGQRATPELEAMLRSLIERKAARKPSRREKINNTKEF